jgi:hypothetical protein
MRGVCNGPMRIYAGNVNEAKLLAELECECDGGCELLGAESDAPEFASFTEEQKRFVPSTEFMQHALDIAAIKTKSRLLQWTFTHTFTHQHEYERIQVRFPDEITGGFAADVVDNVPVFAMMAGQLLSLDDDEELVPASFVIRNGPVTQPFNFDEKRIHPEDAKAVWIDFGISYFWSRPEWASVTVSWVLTVRARKTITG